jgi:organic hydroperoxide reductase OsmC/OhrA
MITKQEPGHHYQTSLSWEGNLGTGTSTYSGYGRNFRIRLAGKGDLVGSADPAFRGDPDKPNPEELLVAALSSCHMLSYLALCARRGIAVVAYEDEALGTMVVTPEGGGRFTEVTLQPKVSILGEEHRSLAMALHDQAAKECFIAASCAFPVRHTPVITCI